MGDVIVVESPTKARHIKHLLGPNYEVIPTVGHLKEMPANDIGIDYANQYEPKLQVIRGKGDVVNKIKATGEKAGRIILATDPDREGEGIAFHLYEMLPVRIRSKCVRAEFHEITNEGILQGLRQLRELDLNMAMAQQARRVIDRMTGYEVSPMLWRRLRGYKGLSAGRVQSAALKLIYDRHQEIMAFKSKEYWTITGEFSSPPGSVFVTELIQVNGQSLKEAPIASEDQAGEVLGHLQSSTFSIISLQDQQKEYAPPPPFITTSLLKASSSELGLGSKRTMKVAQELFEGIAVQGRQATGLITYMRTDSPRVSPEAQKQAREWIAEKYGESFVQDKTKQYEAKEGAQDAHECIRPTDLSITPQSLRGSASADQLKLYSLIYTRFIVSQMAPAVHDERVLTISGVDDSDYCTIFRGFSSRIVFKGWRILGGEGENRYQEGMAEIQESSSVKARGFEAEQHRTKPPGRYTEASLIDTLEKLGIGRPSTYAGIMDTLTGKEYVEIKQKSLNITEIGIKVVETLIQCFPPVLDKEFTAAMERDLDRIATGEVPWHHVVKQLHEKIECAK